MLGEAELSELVESIKANGLRVPIVLDDQGRILDGRNREKACRLAGVEPTFWTYDGDDLAEFVIDANSSRRHMSTGARAMSTALVLADDGRRVNGRWKRGSLGDNPGSGVTGWTERLRECGVVLDYAPELADEIVTGGVALDAAYRKACAIRDEAELKQAEDDKAAAAEAEAEKFILEHAPELADLVRKGSLENFTEAEAVWTQRNREAAERRRAEKAAAEKAAAEEAAAMRDLYTGITRAVQVVAEYGAYSDIATLWSEFHNDHLDPPQLAHALTPEALANARRLIDWLAAWTKENQ